MISNFERQKNNPGALINTNNQGLKAYREARSNMLKGQQEFEKLKTDVSEIKEVLAAILEKLNK